MPKKIYKILIFSAVAIAVIISGVLIIRAVSNRGDAPFIYLKIDEGFASSTYDASGNANTASLNGNATWAQEQDCVSGKCIYLDGSGDYLSIPDFNLE